MLVLSGCSDEFPLDSTNENADYVAEEIASWEMFGDALKNDNKYIFRQMMNELKDYHEAMGTKGSIQVAESMLMALIHIQQKMIKELISKHPHKNFSPFLKSNEE